MTQKQTYSIIIILLILLSLFLGVKYFNASKELKETKSIIATQEESIKFIEFNKVFVSDVLQAKSEVDYDLRLKLDQMIKDINDENLTEQWNKFTNSETEKEAQEETVKLLGLLAEKMQ